MLIINLWNTESAVSFHSYRKLKKKRIIKSNFPKTSNAAVKAAQLRYSHWYCGVWCIYSGGLYFSKVCRCGCKLGAGDLGGTPHTPYGATLPLHTFSRPKVCRLGTQFSTVLWKERVSILTRVVFNFFSPRSICFIVCSNSKLAFYSWLLIGTLLSHL